MPDKGDDGLTGSAHAIRRDLLLRPALSKGLQPAFYQNERAVSFAIATGVIVAWAVTGPLFRYSTNWQIPINTATTIAILVIVFLLQKMHKREGAARDARIDEALRANRAMSERLLHLESPAAPGSDPLTGRSGGLASATARKSRVPGMADDIEAAGLCF